MRPSKRITGAAGAAGGGSFLVGGSITGAIFVAAAVLGFWYLERARKERKRLLGE
jgi:hypothetical protein